MRNQQKHYGKLEFENIDKQMTKTSSATLNINIYNNKHSRAILELALTLDTVNIGNIWQIWLNEDWM